MRILLIEPPKAPLTLGGEDYFMFEPLSLEYLGAAVAGDHDVRLLDMRIDPDLQAVLESFEPDIVGVTAYTVHVNPALACLRTVKAFRPDILTVVGGHHATVRPQDFCQPEVDLVVAGAGIAPFRGRGPHPAAGRPLAGSTPGVYKVQSGQLVGTAPLPEPDLDSAPLPDRSLSTRYRPLYFSEWMKPLATIRTSKGCPFRCTFCALWRLTGGRYLKRSPESIVAELRSIAEPNVFFADDESMINAPGLERLAELIAREGIKKRYFLYGRSDTIVRHPELLERWRDIGLSRVFIGLESFRDEDLAALNKKTSVATNERALRILADLGLEVYASFMVRPDFTREDFRTFRGYCRSLPLTYATFSVLTPLPGTQLFEEKEAELISRNWDLFDFLHTVLPTRLPLEEFYHEYAELLRHAVSLRRALSFLWKFPVREMPGIISRGNALLARIESAHRDYPSSHYSMPQSS